MSYTLRGRLESRLAAALLPLLAAIVLTASLREWWPLELAGLMLGVGLALDAEAYHRLLRYQPGWLALPLGALELGIVTGLALWLGVEAPLWAAITFFVASWLWAQVAGHAAFPLLRLGYAEDGGELGRAATPLLAVAVVGVFAASGGVWWAKRPPTIHLEAGVHQGPLVLDRPQRLVGEEGTIVRGGIVVRSDDVHVRDLTVVGGRNGVDVDLSDDFLLERVAVQGAREDGIQIRRSHATIRDCAVTAPATRWTQGIDVSFSADRDDSVVAGCTVVGGHTGIVTHSANSMIVDNRVSGTTFRGIDMTEMSMGHIERNEVVGANGVAIFCGDRSMCVIEENTVAGTRVDDASGDLLRRGFGILVHFNSRAELDDNHVVASPGGIAALLGSQLFAPGDLDMHAMPMDTPSYYPP
jgi:nitrous oxidase accessory protein NosD